MAEAGMKLITDILKTILDGLFILSLVLAVTGFALSERPWQDTEQAWEPPAMFEFWLVPKVSKFKSAKYEYLKNNRRVE